MKKWSLILAVMAISLCFESRAEEKKEVAPSSILIEDFHPEQPNEGDDPRQFVPGAFPEDWKYRNSKAVSIYGVAREDNTYFVKARSLNSGYQILKRFKANLKAYPVLSWRWRVDNFPGGKVINPGEEPSDKDKTKADGSQFQRLKSDNGATVYAIFSGFLSKTALKYIWSSYYSKGDVIDSGPQLKVIVLRDRFDPKKKWITEERNVYEDYKKYFGKEPPSMIAIAIMSDSDQTESYAEADYTDFVMKRLPF